MDYKDLNSIFQSNEIDSLKNFFSDTHRLFLKKTGMTEEDFLNRCNKYSEKCINFTKRVNPKNYSKQLLQAELQKNTAFEKYGIGGECIHRGYFCPSPIDDIIIGNVKRGRLTKDAAKAYDIHYFDNENRHIGTKRKHGIEYIRYDGESTLGFQYESERISVSECFYDENGRITSYTVYRYSQDKNTVEEMSSELFNYSDGVIKAECVNFSNILTMRLTTDKYRFYIANGYLTAYITDMFCSEDITFLPESERTRKIRIKRKINILSHRS